MPVFDERAAMVGDAPWWAGTAGTEWIDLGDRDVSPLELQQALGLTWGVQKRPLYQYFDGRYARVPNRFSITRDDNGLSLGLVSGRYEPFQNNHIFEFFQKVTDGLALGQVAGEFDGGARVWLLAKLPETIYVAGNDRIDSYTLMTNGHDGKSAFDMFHTLIRVVCRNTHAAAMASRKEGYRLSHYFTNSRNMSVTEARQALGLFSMEEYAQEAEKLAQTVITQDRSRGCSRGFSRSQRPSSCRRRRAHPHSYCRSQRRSS